MFSVTLLLNSRFDTTFLNIILRFLPAWNKTFCFCSVLRPELAVRVEQVNCALHSLNNFILYGGLGAVIIHRHLAKCPASVLESFYQLNFRNQHSAVIYKHCWYMEEVLLLFIKVTNIAQSLVPAGLLRTGRHKGSVSSCLMLCAEHKSL